MDSEKESHRQVEDRSQVSSSSDHEADRTVTDLTADSHGIEGKDHAVNDSSFVESGNASGITAEHRDYLIARHGTADLSPLPTMDPADPLNWPAWKVHLPLRAIE
jgi:hypothetical protein